MTFGEKLDEAIAMRGMKQREFAKAVGTSEVSISRYISNERNPKIQTAVKMANILNVSLDWLCGTASEKKFEGIALYQQGWNDAIDAMQNAKFKLAEQGSRLQDREPFGKTEQLKGVGNPDRFRKE